MAYEHDNGQISIFKNDKKTEDKHPDYKGYGKAPNGTEIEIALWVKDGKNGKFFSGRVELKEQRNGAPKQQPTQPRQDPKPSGDDLPF